MTNVVVRGATELMVSEVFGPTVQGEGPHAGRRVAFIRLGLCNLDCSWCDTPYTWDWTRFDRKMELGRWSVQQLVDQVRAMNVPTVVISGGEPLVQRNHLQPLIEALSKVWNIEVETNGTLSPGTLRLYVTNWNVSPKLSGSGVARDRAWKPDVLRELRDTGNAVFKFVCQTESELDEVDALVKEAGINPRLVWIMPEGIDVATMTTHMHRLADPAIDRGYNLTTRLHVMAWGNTRGK